MASIGEVGANNASKMIRGEMDKVPLCIYFGVFLMAQEIIWCQKKKRKTGEIVL